MARPQQESLQNSLESPKREKEESEIFSLKIDFIFKKKVF